MVDQVPSSIDLSPAQREILNLIIQDQSSVQASAEPEHVILLWSEGVSESTTAQKFGISKEAVRTLRYRWWVATKRIAAAEKKSQKVFNDLVSLIFRISNGEAPSESALNSSVERFKPAAPSEGNQQNTKNYDLRRVRS
jgi:DNA-binding CsgD family transcriptional regulator